VLSRAEEARYLRAYRDGDNEAGKILALSVAPLVVSLASRWSPPAGMTCPGPSKFRAHSMGPVKNRAKGSRAESNNTPQPPHFLLKSACNIMLCRLPSTN